MVIKQYKCHKCGSTNIVKNGTNRNGNKRYKCKDCGVSRVLEYRPPKYSKEKKEEIIRAYMERPSMRGISRVFGTSTNTLASWLKNPNVETLNLIE